MLNLLKYELFRRKKLLAAMLIIFSFLELGVWLGLKLGRNWYIMSIVFLMLLVVGAFAFPFVDAVVNYFSDFKKKNGYMLFLTPNSGYKILGAKIIFTVIELVIVGALLYLALRTNFLTLKSAYPEAVTTIVNDMFEPIKGALGIERVTFLTVFPLLLTAFMQYLANVTIAIFSITIAKTLLSDKDFNWLLALVFFFAIYTVIELINVGVLAAFGFVGEVINLAMVQGDVMLDIRKYLIIGVGIYAVLIAVLYPISSRLINKRIDL